MWEVGFTAKARKQARELPEGMRAALDMLVRQIRLLGPWRPDWPHFGRIKNQNDTLHCHLNKGKPRYVVVWQIRDRRVKLVEVRYVGTHEKARY
jgi:mRNA-degrading endonuclease RelE of RelBE toxin-antitoxin system